jgi:hypothetical protein
MKDEIEKKNQYKKNTIKRPESIQIIPKTHDLSHKTRITS